MKHVILSAATGNRRRRVTRGKAIGARAEADASAAPPSSPITVEVDELAPRRAAEVARKAGVKAVAPVMPMKLIAPVPFEVVDDPVAGGSTWGIKAVGADTSPFSGQGVVVAVLDTGVKISHPAFASIQFKRKNFTTETDEDVQGHGTHCAATIVGRDIAGTRIGIARGVTELLVAKILGEGGGGSDVVLAAIEWALQNGAQVISMSLGIDFPGYVASLTTQGVPTEVATSMALEGYRANVLLFERLASLVQARSNFGQPCVLVAAAGNESRRDINSDFQIGVSPPAVADGIVSVAALGSDSDGFTIAPFSNVGAQVSAPGVGVTSANIHGGLIAMSGTSMATPHVAGVAALWIEKLQGARQLTGRLLSNRLVGSASVTGLKPGFDPGDVGAGMIRAPQEAP